MTIAVIAMNVPLGESWAKLLSIGEKTLSMFMPTNTKTG